MKELKCIVANVGDVDVILDIIRERMCWMDEMGLKQWNDTGYLEYYNRAYFDAGAGRGDFYLLLEEDVPVGTMALFEQDGRWDDDPNYFYVHHLATRRGHPGAGRFMLRFAEELGRARGKKGIRLDSPVDNESLWKYYEGMGYPAVSTFEEDGYRGVNRVKYLDMPISFRRGRAEDLEAICEIEEECFAVHERCSRGNFEKRLRQYPERFLLLTEQKTRAQERICGFISDIRAREAVLTDDMYTERVEHTPEGSNLILLGLNVRPEYRGLGFASMLMQRRLREAKAGGIDTCVLTCAGRMVPYYERFGYHNCGVSGSALGNETWYDMKIRLADGLYQ